ncbi:ROK family protein [Paenibacillus glucanolyticus]|jgi:glucokinase|uniref:ROK family protein n=1 Tax=Paenibacillus TaxID=44249 RepID=UPI0003E1E3CE|nr:MULTISPECIES: ROK family protein [Paenibacillus]ANA81301.1 sugar kinase [Paenibacillus glucanolyticus]AVV59968.1 ROK family protein [Paenibacillus glucanolyticus]ETT35530.1 ROK family protein [Paenibacillus sp. FSL R5-808]MPY19990.1 ROK family protein [Paenibacillus glucanolyticus]OMF68347.1 sugar kinase [Paenibacillus glucanolyticus]
MSYAIGVDIGGTKVQFAVIDREGNITNRHRVPTEANKGPEQLMNKVLLGIDMMMESIDQEEEIQGIGIGSAGQIDYREGTVRYAGDTLPDWTGTAIKEMIARRYNTSVYVDNDVNVIAIAEKMYGVGKHCDHFVCLALGTGIGGAVMEAGRLIRGVFGGAAELGHVSIDINGPRCSCGNNGCVELYASGSGIARLGLEMQRNGSASYAWRPNARDIIQAWHQHDPSATQVMRIVIRALGSAIAGYIHTFNPEAVVVGGGVAQSGPRFLQALDQEVNARTSSYMRGCCRLIPANFGSDAGVIGAAAQVWHYGESSCSQYMI